MEERGVVLRAGRPERLILERPSAEGRFAPWLRGELLVARVARVDRGLGMAFLDAGPSAPQLTATASSLVEGARVKARIGAPARRGKLAVAAVIGPAAEESPGRLHAAPSVGERLQSVAPGAPILAGPEAREACDAAEAEALQTEHAVAGGARLFIEQTRALIAVDVDLAASATGGDPRRRQRQANASALRALPRLLRLKGLGGLVAVDLAGKGHDGPALAETAAAAFAPVFGDGMALGPISRFGILQIQLPWRDTPVAELLLDEHGRPTPVTRALSLLREIEREAGAGGRVVARCAPEVFDAAEPYATLLKAKIGDRFLLAPDATVAPHAPIVSPQ